MRCPGADGTAEQVEVTLGAARESRVEVLHGALRAGDRVVVRGAEHLTAGRPLRIVERSN